MEQITGANKSKYKIIIFVAVLLIIISAGTFWYFSNQITQPVTSFVPSNRADLGLRNSDFARAEGLINSNPSEALNAYQKALQTATADEDIDAIKFRIAMATYKIGYGTGDTLNGVTAFKELIAASSTSNISKSYAVQFLVVEYGSAYDSKLFDQVFSGEPYAGFVRNSGGDKDESLRQLISYGASFNRLPLLMIRLASFKVNDLLAAKNDAEKTRILAEIKDYIAQMDYGITLLKSPNNSQLPLIYSRKGIVLGKLALAGFTLGDPNEAFNKGLEYSVLYNDRETRAFLNYHYAVFLTKQDKVGQKDKIKELLKNIYSETDTNLKVFMYFRNEASAKDSRHDDIVQLSSVDPKFKEMLAKFGWKF